LQKAMASKVQVPDQRVLTSGAHASAVTSWAIRVRRGFVESHSGNHDLSQLGSFRERDGPVARPGLVRRQSSNPIDKQPRLH
jgi:hypothetical protein